jgi:hypothetical protein
MSDSDIEVDSEGMEVRSESEDSDSCDSINEFVTESSEEEEEEDEADPEWFPPPKDAKRVSVKPVRFADQVFDSSEDEDTSDDESESE